MRAKQELEQAIEKLKKTLYNNEIAIKYVRANKQNTRRYYSVYTVSNDKIIDISRTIANATRLIDINQKNEIMVAGCGFCGGHDIATTISTVLNQEIKYYTI